MLVQQLLDGDHYARVVTLVRRPVPEQDPRHTVRVVDFRHLETFALPFEGADVYCALGTTMRQAGSKAAFREVDYSHVVRLAVMAAAGGARSFGLVSASSASVRSPFFYSRVKGEAERAVAAAGLPGVSLFRPALLTGPRAAPRRGERIAEAVLGRLAPVLRGPLAGLRPISAEAVARAMARIVPQAAPGVHVFESDAIRAVAAGVGDASLSHPL
jgi:uncharacterized protein YbjT (DUF2867 family)